MMSLNSFSWLVQRNYRFFFMFVFSATLLCLYVHGFCWVYIRRIMDGEETTIWKAMTKTPASIVLLVYTFISVWFVGGLTVFHLYLISTNQVTFLLGHYGFVMIANSGTLNLRGLALFFWQMRETTSSHVTCSDKFMLESFILFFLSVLFLLMLLTAELLFRSLAVYLRKL